MDRLSTVFKGLFYLKVETPSPLPTTISAMLSEKHAHYGAVLPDSQIHVSGPVSVFMKAAYYCVSWPDSSIASIIGGKSIVSS